MDDFDKFVRPLISLSQSQKVARFNSLLTGWVEKNWDVIDLGCGVGETTVRLKELGAVPVGVGPCKSAIAYATNKYSNISFELVKDETTYLQNLKYHVDCICVRNLFIQTDTDRIKNTVSAALEALKPLGVLILNLDDKTQVDAIIDAFPGLYLAYNTAYRLDTRNTYYFVVFKKKGVN